ncbi:hypothetical protein [Sphingobacterium sp. BN32]|uniref:hypothetical protein n=1 Tax=Sphingobacterium sp. BN32 TaxID=3058432 RepID=UPI00265D3915|nr:hypothetical protein [Sphingobacterium sp. BN32]WKK60179.1 hypothetical protein QYC40_08015 [Sphingobacterium sp. BN32]
MTRDQFEKYLQGKCNEQETAAIERFLQEKEMNFFQLPIGIWRMIRITRKKIN